MTTITAQLPIFLRQVTDIARSVAHRHQGAHHTSHGGHVGTGRTLLVARSAQRHGGLHRAVTS
jgi:hypothetical protein